jgi:hypothetical protein
VTEKDPYITIKVGFTRTDYGDGEIYAETTGVQSVTAIGLTAEELEHWADYHNSGVLCEIIQDRLAYHLEDLSKAVDKDEQKR